MNESHTVFAHIAFEDGSEGKETLSIILSYLHSHLHTLIHDTIQLRHEWLQAHNDRYLAYVCESSNRFKTQGQSTNEIVCMADNKDPIKRLHNDNCSLEIAHSMVHAEAISPTEYFINLSDAAFALWDHELLLHITALGGASNKGDSVRSNTKKSCLERQEENLTRLYGILRPYQEHTNSTDIDYIPAAYTEHYWNRPLWAWHFEQMLLVKALDLFWRGLGNTLETRDESNPALSSTFKSRRISVGISRTKTLSRLPFLYHAQRSQCFRWTLIDPILDQKLISKVLKPLSLNSLIYPCTLLLQERCRSAVSILSYHGIQTVSQLLDMPQLIIQSILQNELKVNTSKAADDNQKHLHNINFTIDQLHITINYLFFIAQGELKQNHGTSYSNLKVNKSCIGSPCSLPPTDTSSNKVRMVTPSSPQQLPRLDSNGIDLNVLKQLPPQLRSEVRISYLQQRKPLKKGQSMLPLKKSAREKAGHNNNMRGEEVSTTEIDSHGIDLKTLSQLPPQIRSEVRSNVLLNRSRRSRTSVLDRWLNHKKDSD